MTHSISTIRYLGPAGTFTEQAATDFSAYYVGPWELVPCRTIRETIRPQNFSNGFALAVVPYYNLIEGLIQETLDLMIEQRLSIFGARQIPVEFAFGGYESANASEPVVLSHHKAIAQCSTFLQENYPRAALREVSSTAQAVVDIAAKKEGFAIASRATFEKSGIPILSEDIGNKQYLRRNYTEFLLIGDAAPLPLSLPENGKHRTVIAIMPTVDRVGLLADILGQISFFGINLLKIHSRPALSDVPWESAPQMFYLEMEVSRFAPELTLCIESLNMRLAKKGEHKNNVVHILGDYFLQSIIT